MAEVYRARAYGPGGFLKEFAVKKILPTLTEDQNFLSMFIDEARVTAFLHHPNVVQVLDLGEIDGALFIGMEFVAGKDLLDILAACARRKTRLSVENCLLTISSVLTGLDFAHNAVNEVGEPIRIVHRDVSPSNIIVGYSGHVKVGDFGIAKSRIQRIHTEVGTQKGKLGYMSPEQVTGAEIDHRSDIFAAAVILFEMLTMSRLFKARNELDVMLKIRDGKIEEDLKRLDDFPPVLRDIVVRGLALDPGSRYQSAGEFLDAIHGASRTLGIFLRPSSMSDALRDLFAEEIEDELARRREDPDPISGYDAHQRAGEALFRYRDPAGQILNGLRISRLREILRASAYDERERVSYNNGPWLSVHRFVDLADTIRADEAVDSAGQRLDPEQSHIPAARSTADWEDLALAAINPRRPRKKRAGVFEVRPPSVSGQAPRSELVLHDYSAPRAVASGLGPPPASTRMPPPPVSSGSGGEFAASAANQITPVSREVLRMPAQNGTGSVRPRRTPVYEHAVPPPQPAPSAPLRTGSRATPDRLPHLSASQDPRLNRNTSAVPDMAGTPPPQPSTDSWAASPLVGPLNRCSLVRIIFRIHRARLTGTLTVRDDGATQLVLPFVHGLPQHARDLDGEDDAIVLLLVAQKAAVRADLDRVLRACRRDGKTFTVEVLRAGVVTPSQLVDALGRRVHARLAEYVTLTRGIWEWSAHAIPDADTLSVPVDVPAVLSRAVQDRLPPGFFSAWFRERMGAAVAIEGGNAQLERLQLSARTMRMVHNLRPGATVQEIVSLFAERFAWNEAETLGSLYLLAELEVVRVDGGWTEPLPG